MSAGVRSEYSSITQRGLFPESVKGMKGEPPTFSRPLAPLPSEDNSKTFREVAPLGENLRFVGGRTTVSYGASAPRVPRIIGSDMPPLLLKSLTRKELRIESSHPPSPNTLTPKPHRQKGRHMNMKRRLRLTLALTATLLLLGIGILGQAQGSSDSTLPDGDWTFSVHPYMGTGYDQRPVFVTATISDITGVVAGVMLKNNSPGTVSAVKLEWTLTTEDNRASTLRSGQTPFIAPSGEIAPGKYKQLSFPIANFAKLSRQFLKRGVLSGDYRIDVAVSEVQYADGTTWVASSREHSRPAAERVAAAPRNPQCPGQRCKLSGRSYTCDAGAPEEVCSNCIKSCINAICGSTMPTCPQKPE